MVEIYNILQVEEYIKSIDFVVFDLDDTLYSEKEYVRSGFKRISEAFSKPELELKLWKAFLQGEKAIDVVLGKEGLLDRKDEALDIYRKQIPIIHLYDGVWDMLCRIKQRGKALGLLTDGRPEGQHAKIESLGLGTIFDAVVITDELGGVHCRKPNEIGFVTLHERTSVAYEKMAYIGDNTNKDFIAPKRLGMQCIFFNNTDGLYRLKDN